jgi:hypothetical protein
VCHGGRKRDEAAAAAGTALLVVVAIFGVSFGGFPLLFTAACLAIAFALTPRPARA